MIIFGTQMHTRISHHLPVWVFVKSKTENQLITFVIAYLVADNNVKCETVEQRETPDIITPDLWPPNSRDLNPVDYRIWGVLQERVYQKLLKTSASD